jgi:hypothetical protein
MRLTRRSLLGLFGAAPISASALRWLGPLSAASHLPEPREPLPTTEGTEDGDIFASTTYPTAELGTRVMLMDGRVFYYGRSAGPTIPAGSLVVPGRRLGRHATSADLWDSLVVADSPDHSLVLGLTPTAVPPGTSTPRYFWVQTWGPAACRKDSQHGFALTDSVVMLQVVP